MDDKIIATFCLCDDLLKAMHHQEDHQCQMNAAAIMTTACIASLCFRGNHESARAMLKQHGYIPHMVSKSRLSRRLHRMKAIFIVLFDLLAQTWKTRNTESIYVIDSIPIAVCDNMPSSEAKPMPAAREPETPPVRATLRQRALAQPGSICPASDTLSQA